MGRVCRHSPLASVRPNRAATAAQLGVWSSLHSRLCGSSSYRQKGPTRVTFQAEHSCRSSVDCQVQGPSTLEAAKQLNDSSPAAY